MLVSHDRYFLNEIVSRIFDISGGSLVAYEGNYEVYAEKKRADRDASKIGRASCRERV